MTGDEIYTLNTGLLGGNQMDEEQFYVLLNMMKNIRESSRDWTIVRPGLLTNGPARGAYQVLVEPRTWRGGFISRADVGKFLTLQVDDRALIGKAPVLID